VAVVDGVRPSPSKLPPMPTALPTAMPVGSGRQGVMGKKTILSDDLSEVMDVSSTAASYYLDKL
jgi:hypothetical protein